MNVPTMLKLLIIENYHKGAFTEPTETITVKDLSCKKAFIKLCRIIAKWR